MGRKNLFAGLSGEELPAGNSPIPAESQEAPVAPHLSGMGNRGAIGAVTRSIEQMRAHAVVELAADLIEASFITDRLEGSQEAHQTLVNSIREHGQQVPILVRPHPDREGRYQIAYGRRRLRALAELGRPARTIIKPLTDQQLVVAQGQENSARTDLSFIEKALFAAKLEEGGFHRETIMASLSIDKTGLSRLISAAVKVPRGLIEAIGPAPKTGRDRWTELATRLEQTTALEAVERLVTKELFSIEDSDARFAAVFNAAAPRPAKLPRPKVWTAPDGARIARIAEDERKLSLVLDKKVAGGFGAYLVEALPEIYAAFKRREEQSDQNGKERTKP